ncbi:S1C family serine protease [Halalkalibacillus halophilus]|uniref:S1C family serine protease n=1 Tax=Halalkalibacillus halophilus TaxID=392827 RepID=UPI0004044855|nr:trypsin-like peptidase domain-containing protein [Halalkalibacillus halophilus]
MRQLLYNTKRALPITLSLIVVVAAIFTLSSYYSNWQESSISSSDGIVELVSNEAAPQQDLQTLIHEAQKNVVQIEASGQAGSSQGSGFIYNDQGDIVTNAHVVRNADSVMVKTSEAQTYPGAVIGIGESDDVAVIRVPQLANQNSLEVDPSYEPNVGDDIIAVGSPHGFQNTVTLGIISGKNRGFTVDNYTYENLYQISADISQGNSGGPLIHQDTGKIVAINSASTREGNTGFSIPLGQVFDRILMWSDTANEEELDYDGDPSTNQSVSAESLEEDAEYLINYFYETINLRDYFTAYSLLGSEEQIKHSYQEFRELVVHSIDIEVTNEHFNVLEEEEKIEVLINSDHNVRVEEEKRETHHYQTEYVIGYENDQLKLLSIERELLSKTEHSNNNSNDS